MDGMVWRESMLARKYSSSNHYFIRKKKLLEYVQYRTFVQVHVVSINDQFFYYNIIQIQPEWLFAIDF